MALTTHPLLAPGSVCVEIYLYHQYPLAWHVMGQVIPYKDSRLICKGQTVNVVGK
jgi:hypothetical protein